MVVTRINLNRWDLCEDLSLLYGAKRVVAGRNLDLWYLSPLHLF